MTGAHMIPLMADRNEIIAHLDELLGSPGFPDYGPNGLQVPGAIEVDTVVTGVSATLELFETAAARGAQMVLVHHGIFWGEHAPISQQQADRLRALLTNDINLVAYHLPLDAHPDHGNNALLADALDLPVVEPFGEYKGRKIGVLAECSPIAGSELAARIERTLDRKPLHFAVRRARTEQDRDRQRLGAGLPRGSRSGRRRRADLRRAGRTSPGQRQRADAGLLRGRAPRHRENGRSAARRADQRALRGQS